MKIKIEFGIENGQKFEYISIDGKTETHFGVSRKLTGATDEDVNGIFNYISSSITYGEYTKERVSADLGQHNSTPFLRHSKARALSKFISDWSKNQPARL